MTDEEYPPLVPYCECGQEPPHYRHGNDGKPRVLPPQTEDVEYGGPHG